MQAAPYDTDLLDHIPLTARTVLVVGCGDGALIVPYRRMNPRARLLGIVMDADSATLAARHMDQAVTSLLDVEPLPFALPDGIDCMFTAGFWNMCGIPEH